MGRGRGERGGWEMGRDLRDILLDTWICSIGVRMRMMTWGYRGCRAYEGCRSQLVHSFSRSPSSLERTVQFNPVSALRVSLESVYSVVGRGGGRLCS